MTDSQEKVDTDRQKAASAADVNKSSGHESLWKDKTLRELFWYGLLFALPASGAMVCLLILVSGRRLPLGSSLYYVYFLYVALLLYSLHYIFFKLNAFLERIGSAQRKRVPRYLEYAYALLISFGLLQIVFAGSRAFDYLTFVFGDEKHIATLIVAQSRSDLATKCGRAEFREYFTPDYCVKLATISKRGVDPEYFANELSKEVEFLKHPIGRNDDWLAHLVRGPIAGQYLKLSPISVHVENLVTLQTYRRSYVDEKSSSNVFWWISLLLFPLGISLRIVKTSLELFGRLESR